MYPLADIPTMQLSVNGGLAPEEYYALGEKLSVLREEGVLIIGSGNVVHNLRKVDWNKNDGYDWAEEFDQAIKEAILSRDYGKVFHYRDLGESAKLAVPTRDHFVPLLYVLGAAGKEDPVEVFNQLYELGSMSMTGYAFGMDQLVNREK